MAAPLHARRRWLFTVVALIAAAGILQVTAVGAITCWQGLIGAREWLHTSIQGGIDVENAEIITRLHAIAVDVAHDDDVRAAVAAAAAAGESAGAGAPARVGAAVEGAWPEPDADEAWAIASGDGRFFLSGGLPCEDAAARLARIGDRGSVDCGGAPFLVARAGPAATGAGGGSVVWVAHRLGVAYVDAVARTLNVGVAVVSPGGDTASSLHDLAGARVPLPALATTDAARAAETFTQLDIHVPGGFEGFHGETLERDIWINRGDAQVPMFVATRPLGGGSDAIVAMLVPTDVLMGTAALTTAAAVVCALFTVILLAVVALGVVKRYTTPLADVEKAARAIVAGDLSARAPVAGDIEVRSLATSFNTMIDKLARSRTQLLQSEKLSAIGQLAAGIAHEINTPMQYISDNTHFIEKSFKKIVEGDGDVSFFKAEVPKAIAGAVEGIERVTSIVRAMKDFSHPSRGVFSDVHVKGMLETTAAISKNEWKYVADLVIDVPDDMPPVPALKDELSGAILNMIVNAAHAVGEARSAGGVIALSARVVDDQAEIAITDNGSGIRGVNLSRVFDPFFTTKEAGKGTGQGLAIAWQVVVDKHGGTLTVRSDEGRGTTFSMRLPLARPPATTTKAQPPSAALTAA